MSMTVRYDGDQVVAEGQGATIVAHRPAPGAAPVHASRSGSATCGVDGGELSATWFGTTCGACLAVDPHNPWVIAMREVLAHWAATPPMAGRYPHRCPRCRGAAFVGFNQVDCLAGCGR